MESVTRYRLRVLDALARGEISLPRAQRRLRRGPLASRLRFLPALLLVIAVCVREDPGRRPLRLWLPVLLPLVIPLGLLAIGLARLLAPRKTRGLGQAARLLVTLPFLGREPFLRVRADGARVILRLI